MKVLVTAGPTREPLDPVRFISNRSTGKMGYAIAAAALRAGHPVVLISGPVSLEPPPGVQLIRVTTAAEMFAAVKRKFRACDVCVMAAAVADWRPAAVAKQKCKKADGPPQIEWEPTEDILKTLAPLWEKSQVVCGFAAETNRMAQEAKRKVVDKKLDAIAANDVSKNDRGFESDSNALTLYFRDGKVRRRTRATKTKCAEWLMRVLEEIFEQKKSQKIS